MFSLGRFVRDSTDVQFGLREEREMGLQFNLWLRGCGIAGTLPWCLEGEGETALYQTKRRYECQGREYFADPVYHVWIEGRCYYTGLDYQTALAIFLNHAQGLARFQ